MDKEISVNFDIREHLFHRYNVSSKHCAEIMKPFN